jgi:hypothetical protein
LPEGAMQNRSVTQRKISDLNVAGIEPPSKFASRLGDAHQLIVAGILMRLGFHVSISLIKGEPFDMVVFAYRRPKGEQVPLRCQVKTSEAGRSIHFTAGTRGGVDRVYRRPSPKEYKYTTQHNDLIIGVDKETLDLYLIPTRFVEKWKEKSKTLSKLEPLRNNWGILLNWNDEYLSELEKKLTAETSEV